MKTILEFDLPEDEDDLQWAQNGHKYFHALKEMEQLIFNNHYEPVSSDQFFQILKDRKIELD